MIVQAPARARAQKQQQTRKQQTQQTRKPPQCRCLDDTTQKQCLQTAINGSLFCTAHLHSGCAGSPLSGSEPNYDADKYNNNKQIQLNHNCYDYSMRVIDPKQLVQCRGRSRSRCRPGFHQPGGTHGLSSILQQENGRSCKVVDYLMRKDIPDLEPTTFTAKCPVGKSKIALVVHPGEDYHFYSQNKDGMWTHKDGGNPVKWFDAEHMAIWNPETAARDYRPKGSYLNYTDFCGFYCAPRNREIHLSRGGHRHRRTKKRSRTRTR